MKEWELMPTIRSLKEFNWDLSWKGFKGMISLIKSLFTDEKKLKNWVYLYSFILVPLLNFLIIYNQEETLISIGGGFSSVKYSPINITLMSILIAFTMFTFSISLLAFKRVRPFLVVTMFTQIIILFFEINIIREYAIYYPDSMELGYLILFLCLLSILFGILKLLKLVYLRIKSRVLLKRN
ncbi:MAG: hypothetical protein KGD64_05680 [Candidatus Heimdallarchaeota archaeon]|nr:hypothetical protein [Candidatus Heimdallarchaeota archaeon]